MATPIVMPQMGYDMREGAVLRWLKAEGESVSRGEIIAEIETDKAAIEMQAFTAGVLGKIVLEPGRTVPVGEIIAVITDPGEEVPTLEMLTGQAAPPTGPKTPSPAPTPTIAEPSEMPPTEVRASPIARRLAREKSIDLARLTGTGPGGRIVEKDVLDYAERMAVAPSEAPPTLTIAPTAKRVELSRMRQAIARVTSQSKRESPHFYVTTEIDMTAAMDMRRQVNQDLEEEGRVSVNDLVVKACAMALQTHPKFNSSFREDHLELHSAINIGIAIALEGGLIIAAVPACQEKSLAQIARASHDLIRRAEGGALHPQEYESTFSISNMGMYDVDSFSAIIYPPNAAVLALGAVKEQPVVREGQVTVAQIMKATLSVDHRVADGAEAARFLVELRSALEKPATLML